MENIDDSPLCSEDANCNNVSLASGQITPLTLFTNSLADHEMIPTFVADQTPTPTRLLKTCEDVGLFPFISDEPTPPAKSDQLHHISSSRNPFDVDFRQAAIREEQERRLERKRASRASSSRRKSDVTAGDSDAEGNTVGENSLLSAQLHVMRGSSRVDGNDVPPIPSMIIDEWQGSDVEEEDMGVIKHDDDDDDNEDDDHKVDNIRNNDNEEDRFLGGSSQTFCSQPVESYNSALLISDSILSPDVQSITSPASSTLSQHHQVSAIEKRFVQVLLQLPNGSLAPFNLPIEALKQATPSSVSGLQPLVGSSVSSLSLAGLPMVQSPQSMGVLESSVPSSPAGYQLLTSPTVQSILSSVVATQPPLAAAHQAKDLSVLQDTLIPLPVVVGTVSSNTGIAEKTKQRLKVQLNQIKSSNEPVIPVSSHTNHRSSNESSSLLPQMEGRIWGGGNSMAVGRANNQHDLTKTDNSSNRASDDESDRKRQALESNRAAATRSRNKKKTWVTNLEAKTNELQRINKQLLVETNKLKEEIDMLKRALDEHKDCPPSYPNYTNNR